MAISAKYMKTLINRQFIVDEARETAADIYHIQRSIAQNHSGTGNLYRFLSQKPFNITQTSSSVKMELPYPLKMRYMDMRHDIHGKLKKNYDPIYNKIVWGLIYGYLYKRLIYGVSRDMNAAIVERLKNAGFKIS